MNIPLVAAYGVLALIIPAAGFALWRSIRYARKYKKAETSAQDALIRINASYLTVNQAYAALDAIQKVVLEQQNKVDRLESENRQLRTQLGME